MSHIFIQGLKSTLLIVFMSMGILFFTFLGFQKNFPGKVLSDVAQKNLEFQSKIPTQIMPVRLAWDHIEIPELAFFSPAWMTEIPRTRLLVIEQIKVPYLPLLRGKTLKLFAKLHEGRFMLSADLLNSGKISFSLKGLELQRMPASSVLPYGIPTGTFSFQGEIPQWTQDFSQIQQGTFSGELKDFHLKWKKMEGMLSDLTLPELALNPVQIQGSMGDIIEIDSLTMKGDLEGSITGNMRINTRNFQNSQLVFHAQVQVAPNIMESLGGLKFLVKGFQCGEVFNVKFTGTLSQINPPKRGSCS